jgi:hypothetical protein
MDTDLFNILRENNIAFPQVIDALTSRDIRSLTHFLEKGEHTLKNMREKWAQIGQFSHSKEYFNDAFDDFKLITPVQYNTLMKVLQTLRDKK